jgi:crossover junction endodeoxyribonuclease RuvC
LSRIIIGIDPGLTRCGVGVVEVSANRTAKFVSVETVRSDAELPLAKRLNLIATELEKIIDLHKPDLVAIERVFSQQNVSTVMGTAQISGIVMLLAERRGIAIQMHTPTEVKAAVTGSGRSGKLQVGTMVAKILGLKEIPKPADSADALAIAITAGWRANIASETGVLTKAQAAWQSAEAASKKNRKH